MSAVMEGGALRAPEAAALAACNRVAPVWPLRRFVAVNPFLGLVDRPFAQAVAGLRRAGGPAMLMPRSFYRAAVRDGRIAEADLVAALEAAEPKPVPDLAALLTRVAEDPPPIPARVQTVAETFDRVGGPGLAELVTAQVGAWCASYWDEGQASWPMPWRDLAPFPAWRACALIDRGPDVAGLAGFRAHVATLPETAGAAIETALARLEVPEAALDLYLDRVAGSLAGWMAHARRIAWDTQLYGQADDTPLQLMAILLSWDAALLALHPDRTAAWAEARLAMSRADAAPDPAIAVDLVLHDAYERGAHRRIPGRLNTAPPAAPPPAVQAAFCIDVRSEPLRRALERVGPVQTVGFAGFFGFPIEYVPIGQAAGMAQCPVLLTPQFIVCETVKDPANGEERFVLDQRVIRRRAARAWKAFKSSAVSSFPSVETMGLGYAAKLLGDSLGWSRPVADPVTEGLDDAILARLGLTLEPRSIGDRQTGFLAEQRVAMAEAVLRAMSMTSGFARLVLLTGHAGQSVNNPHAAGLDCGACGGHSGEANARVAAAVLNDRGVRDGLRARGIDVPAETWFLPAVHDTTTDSVTVLDDDRLPASHRAEANALTGWLRAACDQVRAERAARMGVHAYEVAQRAHDWSEVRPEWALADCAAFIAAPRWRTAGLDLGGRAFLHEYDWQQDSGFDVLTLIMSAPMVVASWISLQYFGSVVDNRAFGCGNKTLHNVVGTIGVLEGNGGDLRTGLPWQSVHDGARLQHEPVRLSVLIEAPAEAIEAVLAARDDVRPLVENGWLFLSRIAPDGGVFRWTRGGWVAS